MREFLETVLQKDYDESAVLNASKHAPTVAFVDMPNFIYHSTAFCRLLRFRKPHLGEISGSSSEEPQKNSF